MTDNFWASLPLVFSLLLLCGLMFWMQSLAASDSLARNGLVGIRTRATLASDEAWTAGHKAAIPALRFAWVSYAVLSPAYLIFAVLVQEDWVPWVGVIALLTPILVLLGATLGPVKKAALAAHRAENADHL